MANPVTERLLPLAISDAALFHSLMSFSSSLLDERSGRKTPGTTALFHLGCAIRLLNEALNDTKCAASDKVLATICLVAGHNVSGIRSLPDSSIADFLGGRVSSGTTATTGGTPMLSISWWLCVEVYKAWAQRHQYMDWRYGKSQRFSHATLLISLQGGKSSWALHKHIAAI